jgi:hypothetical protein
VPPIRESPEVGRSPRASRDKESQDQRTPAEPTKPTARAGAMPPASCVPMLSRSVGQVGAAGGSGGGRAGACSGGG